MTKVCQLTEGKYLLCAMSQLSGGGCRLGCLSGGLKVSLNSDVRGSECSSSSLPAPFFIMCMMCKIMGADNPGGPAADPAGSCGVSTPHATEAQREVTARELWHSVISLPLPHYKRLHIQMAASL